MIGIENARRVVPKPSDKRLDPSRGLGRNRFAPVPGANHLRGRQTFGVLLKPFGAEQFCPDRGQIRPESRSGAALRQRAEKALLPCPE
jgi:hypothetical protein